MTNHKNRQRDRLAQLSESDLADMATLSTLRKAAVVGRYHSEQHAAVLDTVKAAEDRPAATDPRLRLNTAIAVRAALESDQ